MVETLSPSLPFRLKNSSTMTSRGRVIQIGNVRLSMPQRVHATPEEASKSFALTPLVSQFEGLFPRSNTRAGQRVLAHLKWMLQKDLLGQDMLLYGSPGHYRRRLVHYYCAVVGKELEQLIITPDTSEADLKERREVDAGSIRYTMQAPLRAAVHGRMLLLVDVHKAERNVLPTLNNLLENREMNLPSGRRLVHHAKKQHQGGPEAEQMILRCAPDFRVCALGSPVPTYPGYTLDPPFRSRFQCRVAEMADLVEVGEGESIDALEALRTCMARPDHTGELLNVLRSSIAPLLPFPPRVPILGSVKTAVAPAMVEAGTTPRIPFCPWDSLLALPLAASLPMRGSTDPEVQHRTIAQRVYPISSMGSINTQGLSMHETCVLDGLSTSSFDSFADVVNGVRALRSAAASSGGRGGVCCIIGPRCSGKSVAARAALTALGGESTAVFHTLHVYKELSSMDLLQRRTLNANGNSSWTNSPLVTAAMDGVPIVLDGVHRVNGILSVIASLVHDHWLQLPSGEQLVPQAHFDELLAREMKALPESECRRLDAISMLTLERKIWPVRRGFFVVALAEPSTVDSPWLESESIALLKTFFQLPPLSVAEILSPTPSSSPSVPDLGLLEKTRCAVVGLQEVMGGRISPRSVHYLKSHADMLSLRGDGENAALPEMREAISRTLLVPFHGARDACEGILNREFPSSVVQDSLQDLHTLNVVVGEDSFRIGRAVGRRLRSDAVDSNLLSFVSYFVEIQSQLKVLERIVMELFPPRKVVNAADDGDASFQPSQRHFLLIGNQGTGKNKLCDQLLTYMNAEREYMQLNRDSTLASLCIAPSVVGGKMVWEPSPLLRAMELGRVAVLDEADKAPLEAVAVLKALLSDEMLSLPDGRVARRRRVDEATDPNVLYIHPEFRCFVLANRPGFPFLGNDFFRECGDIFSCHIVENPDLPSEVALVTAYAPNVAQQTLQKLCLAFSGLRQRADRGELAYPFSTRELVNVAKHLNAFPTESVADALRNVLDFDSYTPHVFALVKQQLQDAGVVLEASGSELAPTEPIRCNPDESPAMKELRRFYEKTFEFPPLEDATRQACSSLHPRDVSNEVAHDVRPTSLIKFQNPRSYHFSELRFEGQLAAFYAKPSAGAVSKTVNPPPVSPTRFVTQMARVVTLDQEEEIAVISCAKPNTLFIVPMKCVASTGNMSADDLEANIDAREVDVTFMNGAISAMVAGPPVAGTTTPRSVFIISTEAKALWEYFPATSARNSRLFRFELPTSVYSGEGVSATKYVPQTLGKRIQDTESFLQLAAWGGHDLCELLITNSNTFSCARIRCQPSADSSLPSSVTIEQRSVSGANLCSTCQIHPVVQRKETTRDDLVTWALVDTSTKTTIYWPFLPLQGCEDFANDKEFGRLKEDAKDVPQAAKRLSVAELRRRATERQQATPQPANDTSKSIAAITSCALGQDTAFFFVNSVDGDATTTMVHVSRKDSSNNVQLFPSAISPAAPRSVLRIDPLFCYLAQDTSIIVARTISKSLASPVDLQMENTADEDLVMWAIGDGGRRATTVRRLHRQQAASLVRPGISVGNAIVAAVPVEDRRDGDNVYLRELVTVASDGVVETWEMDRRALEESKTDWGSQLGRSENTAAKLLDITIKHTESATSPTQTSDEVAGASAQQPGGSVEGGLTGLTSVQDGGSQGAGNGGSSGPGGGGGGSGQNTGGNLQSDGRGGYAFDESGAAKNVRVQRRRQVSNQAAVQNPTGDVQYDQLLATVQADVHRVVAVLEAAEAKEKERQWVGGRMQGELDDRRLVESVIGEQNVFKRRQVPPSQLGLPQRKPKYIDLVVDVSASMARFNAWDQRLDRLAESMTLVMEAVKCFPAKFTLDIHGHSGSAVRLPLLASLVPISGVPKNVADVKDRISAVDRARSHARSCLSGDGTVEAMKLALAHAAEVDADEKFVILISDANLGGYGVTPKELSQMLLKYVPAGTGDAFRGVNREQVSAHLVFLAELEASNWFIRELPPGVGHHCPSTAELPTILRNIILASLSK